ncbi:MAG: DUF2203 domain-containing protein [Vulcanimicrobiaceae bacterium]
MALSGAGKPGHNDEAANRLDLQPAAQHTMKMFSPERANALIPVLGPLVDQLRVARREIAIASLEAELSRRVSHGASDADVGQRTTAARLKEELARLVARIESHGCIVKDLDLGLLDFPSVRAGQPIYLCWKLGEPEIVHWHGIDETFADRKRV